MQLNINTDAVVGFTNTIEKIHKSALPTAIRGALNKAVFNVKTKTLQESAQKTFVKREPNFFKANSRFENATGFNISTMKATVGMIEGGLKGGNNYAVKDLEEQESGGSIDKKSFIPTVFARKGGSLRGNVRANARLSNINNIIKSKNSPGKNDHEKFIIAASIAGKGGFVLHNNLLLRIDSAPKSNIKNKNTLVKATPLYTFKKSRKVSVRSTGFMKEASLKSAEKIEDYFVVEAQRQIEKFK